MVKITPKILGREIYIYQDELLKRKLWQYRYIMA